jgi:transglutaminase-like putative cysteine protease
MAVIYEITHTTDYKYANPVTLGEHRAMFLPRGSYRGRILHYSIATNIPSTIHWISDTLSNSVAVMEFDGPTKELSVTCIFRAVHFGIDGIEKFPLAERAKLLPVQYTPDEWDDLMVYLRPHSEDQDGSVAAWAKTFIANDRDETADVLQRMMDCIRDTFTYHSRPSEGTQSPNETLSTKTGTCRDYAWLMIEALRRLGVACRFVSGYLYDSSLDGGDVGAIGSSSTHAWLSVYLPGSGWLPYDPKNRITEGFELIDVAIADHPDQASPLRGTWFGSSGDYEGMSIDIAVHKVGVVEDYT